MPGFKTAVFVKTTVEAQQEKIYPGSSQLPPTSYIYLPIHLDLLLNLCSLLPSILANITLLFEVVLQVDSVLFHIPMFPRVDVSPHGLDRRHFKVAFSKFGVRVFQVSVISLFPCAIRRVSARRLPTGRGPGPRET